MDEEEGEAIGALTEPSSELRKEKGYGEMMPGTGTKKGRGHARRRTLVHCWESLTRGRSVKGELCVKYV